MKEIRTRRLLLRPFRESDFEDLYELLSQRRDEEFEAYPGLTREICREKLDKRITGGAYYAMELCESGKLIGNVYCAKKPYAAREVGYIVNKDYQRRGYGFEALSAVVDNAFREGAHRIYAECDPRNVPSWKLMEKVGMRREGLLRQNIFFRKDEKGAPVWNDSYLYAVLKQDRPIPVGTDLSWVCGSEKFNCRVCGLLLSEGRILAMHDERSPYFYLPGGRVRLGETAEEAILREIREELGVEARIIRPLWLNQAFFTEDVDGLRYHELCLYFLLDASGTELGRRGERFTLREGKHVHEFEWLPFERLKDEYFYPVFLKREIFRLPEVFTLRTERE